MCWLKENRLCNNVFKSMAPIPSDCCKKSKVLWALLTKVIFSLPQPLYNCRCVNIIIPQPHNWQTRKRSYELYLFIMCYEPMESCRYNKVWLVIYQVPEGFLWTLSMLWPVFISLQVISLTKKWIKTPCHAGAIRQMLYLPNRPVYAYRGNKSP